MDKKKRREEYKNAENAPTFYVNSVQMAQTAFDLRMMMGVLTEADDDKVVTRVDAVVFMSHQHAKVMLEVLRKHVEKYESLHGPLSVEVTPEALAITDGKA